MKNTPSVANKINENTPNKVVEFMKENSYHPYYTTKEHRKLIFKNIFYR